MLIISETIKYLICYSTRHFLLGYGFEIGPLIEQQTVHIKGAAKNASHRVYIYRKEKPSYEDDVINTIDLQSLLINDDSKIISRRRNIPNLLVEPVSISLEFGSSGVNSIFQEIEQKNLFDTVAAQLFHQTLMSAIQQYKLNSEIIPTFAVSSDIIEADYDDVDNGGVLSSEADNRSELLVGSQKESGNVNNGTQMQIISEIVPTFAVFSDIIEPDYDAVDNGCVLCSEADDHSDDHYESLVMPTKINLITALRERSKFQIPESAFGEFKIYTINKRLMSTFKVCDQKLQYICKNVLKKDDLVYLNEEKYTLQKTKHGKFVQWSLFDPNNKLVCYVYCDYLKDQSTVKWTINEQEFLPISIECDTYSTKTFAENLYNILSSISYDFTFGDGDCSGLQMRQEFAKCTDDTLSQFINILVKSVMECATSNATSKKEIDYDYMLPSIIFKELQNSPLLLYTYFAKSKVKLHQEYGPTRADGLCGFYAWYQTINNTIEVKRDQSLMDFLSSLLVGTTESRKEVKQKLEGAIKFIEENPENNEFFPKESWLSVHDITVLISHSNPENISKRILMVQPALNSPLCPNIYCSDPDKLLIASSYTFSSRKAFSYLELRDEICIARRIMFNNNHFNCHQASMNTAVKYTDWKESQINSMRKAFVNFVSNIVRNIQLNVGDMLKIALQEHENRLTSTQGK